VSVLAWVLIGLGIVVLAVAAIAVVAWLIIGALGIAQVVGSIVDDYRRKADDE
jgi:hypothetical protein